MATVINDARLITSSLRKARSQIESNVLQMYDASDSLNEDGEYIKETLDDHKITIKDGLKRTKTHLRGLKIAEIQEKYGIKFSLWIFTLTAVFIILRRLRVFVLIYFIFGWNKKENIKKDINFNKKTDLHSEIQFNEEIKKKENFQNNIPKKEWVNIESNIDGTISIESKDIIKKDIKDNIELDLNREIELKKEMAKKESFENNIPNKEWVRNIESNIDGTSILSESY
jgi:hypothetical protein